MQKPNPKAVDTTYEAIIRTALDGFWLVDTMANIIDVNDAYCKMIGYSRAELLKMKIGDVEAIEKPRDVMARMRRIMKKGGDSFETMHKRKDGSIIDLEISVNRSKENSRIFVFMRDITDKKQMQNELIKRSGQLERKAIALREVIEQIEIEKDKVKEDIMVNVKQLVLPLVRKLKLKGAAHKYVGLLENRLQKLTSSFGSKLTHGHLKLTPKEIEVCNLLEGGFTSKDIADALNISYQTVEKHRKAIRRKLGIGHKKLNLTTYLQNINNTKP